MAGQLDSLALMFKPEALEVTDRNDPELYLQEWLEYVERYQKFLIIIITGIIIIIKID